MSATVWMPQQATVPTPADFASYLREQGWTPVSATSAWALYEKGSNGDRRTLEVPQRAAAADYARAVAILLEDLARLETRPPTSVLRDVKASTVDVARLGIEGSSTRDGRIPVEAGRRVYGAARDMLLSAVCSVIDPRPVFATRKPEMR